MPITTEPYTAKTQSEPYPLVMDKIIKALKDIEEAGYSMGNSINAIWMMQRYSRKVRISKGFYIDSQLQHQHLI